MISAVVITRDESHIIGKTITALIDTVDEVIVIDHHSTDNTAEIASNLGAQVIVRPWEGYSKAKNFGNQQASNDWILSIDADEVISEELATSISQLKPKNNTVYQLDRANMYCGEWVKHCGWYPDWKVRLFNKQNTRWVGDYVHEDLSFDISPQVVQLEGKLWHHSYITEVDHQTRMIKYAKLGAEKIIAAGKKPSRLKQILSPSFRFFRTLILKKGILDGALGWKISSKNYKMIQLKYQFYRELKKINKWN